MPFLLKTSPVTFNAELLARLLLGTRIDTIFTSRFGKYYRFSEPRRHYSMRTVPPDEYHVFKRKSPFWRDFPETLKPIYYYYRLKRSDHEKDRFWQMFRPVLDFSLAVKGLKEENRDEAGQVDEVMQVLCEGVGILGDGRAERLLFDPGNYLQKPQYAAKMNDHSEIIQGFYLAQLFRAIRKHDGERVRRALTRGTLLDWSSVCFGREPLIYSIQESDEKVVATMLTYGQYKDPRNRPRQLVSAIQSASQLQNTRMMQLLLDHPLGIRQVSIQSSKEEDDSDQIYARPVCWRRDVAENDIESNRVQKIDLLQQALNAVVKEAVRYSDVILFDFAIHLHPNAEIPMLKRALGQAVKASNVALATHILNYPVSSMIDLNETAFNTLTFLQRVITQHGPMSSRVNMARLLIAHGADPNKTSWTPHPFRVDGKYQHSLKTLNCVPGERHDLFKVLVEGGTRIEECKTEIVDHLRRRTLLEEFGQVDWVRAALEGVRIE